MTNPAGKPPQQVKVGVKQRGRRDCEELYFKPMTSKMAVIVFVKFVVGFLGHEFHELTPTKFSTASEEFTAA